MHLPCEREGVVNRLKTTKRRIKEASGRYVSARFYQNSNESGMPQIIIFGGMPSFFTPNRQIWYIFLAVRHKNRTFTAKKI